MSLGGTSTAPAPAARERPRLLRHARERLRSIPSEVWLTAAAVVGFIVITIWWLTQDDRVQDWDNGLHSIEAFTIHDQLAAGQLTAPFTEFNTYPPLGHFVGALGVFIAGKSPATVILASNLVFVPLLAAGTRPGSARASAPSATSTTRCEVSTLPAPTAAGGRGFTTLPSGAISSSTRKSPSLTGRSPPIAQRSA